MEEKAIKNGNSAAFMQPGNNGGVWDSGMSKREVFAAMALQGIMSNQKLLENLDEIDGGVAGHAVRHADALLWELEKTAQ